MRVRCKIGYGSSAVVYEAMYKPLKKRVAVKMIDLDMFERNQIDELRVGSMMMTITCIHFIVANLYYYYSLERNSADGIIKTPQRIESIWIICERI
jgi:serine/threonine protein kinase